MKMQFAYGIYEGEIDPVLAAVRSQRPLAEIEAMPCPCCGAGMTVEFSPEGNGFSVHCAGDPLHISTYRDIANPPPWWEERIPAAGPVTFYWREWNTFADDGTVVIKVSGYDEAGAHWTGAMEVLRENPDYGLWRWIIGQGDRFKSLISDKELESIRLMH